jgi:uncharacterized protein YegP (UPF0339 family)
MTARFEIRKSDANQFIFTLSDPDGQRLFTSEIYPSAADARRAIATLTERVIDFPSFERRKTPENEMYFIVRTVDAKVIGSGERHTSIAALEKNIEAVNRHAAGAEIVETNGGGNR